MFCINLYYKHQFKVKELQPAFITSQLQHDSGMSTEIRVEADLKIQYFVHMTSEKKTFVLSTGENTSKCTQIYKGLADGSILSCVNCNDQS